MLRIATMFIAIVCTIALTTSCEQEELLVKEEGTTGLLSEEKRNDGRGAAYFVDIDYSPKLTANTSGENIFLVTVVRADGTFETYKTGSEGSDRELVASSDKTVEPGFLRQPRLANVIGQAFGPDVVGKGNDFAYVKAAGANKIEVWTGEQKDNEIEYHQRGKKTINGSFVDIDYSPEFSTADYNGFVVTVNDGGTYKTYFYSTEQNLAPLRLMASGEKLQQGVVGQAFGPDVPNKGNDFAFARDIGDKVQFWIGEQKVGRDGTPDVKYHQRNKYEVRGEFVDLDYSPEFSTSSYNGFIATVNDGGQFNTYVFYSERNGAPSRGLVAQDRLLQGIVGQAFGPDVPNKGNDFRYAKPVNGSQIQLWIGEQKVSRGNADVKYHQRGRFELGDK